LKEINRVLAPGGRFVFLEHVVADAGAHPWLAALQVRQCRCSIRLISWARHPPIVTRYSLSVQHGLTRSGVWPAIGDGCHLTRRTEAAIRAVPGWHFDARLTRHWFNTFDHVAGVAIKDR
jgi:hypothetical protein